MGAYEAQEFLFGILMNVVSFCMVILPFILGTMWRDVKDDNKYKALWYGFVALMLIKIFF